MRILLFAWGLRAGAWSHVSQDLASGLAEHGHDVHISHVHDGGVRPARLDGRVQLHRLGGRSSYVPLTAQGVIRRLRPDKIIAFSSMLNGPAVVASALSGQCTNTYLNEGSTLSYKGFVEHRSDLRFRSLPLVARYLYPLARGVVAASDAIASDLTAVAPQLKERTHTIRNPVNTSYVEARAMEGLPSLEARSRPRFCVVGRLARQKGHVFMLRAFSLYRSRGGAGSVTIIGDGPLRGEVEESIVELGLDGCVYLMGHLPNPYPLMAASDCLVLTSEEEGFGLVLVEALALGLDIIATPCPGGVREVLDGGRQGNLLPRRDVETLGDALMKYQSQNVGETVGSSIVYAQRFAPTAVAAEWLDLIS